MHFYPTASDEPKVYKDSYINFSLQNYPDQVSFNVTIEASIEICPLEKTYFNSRPIEEEYLIDSEFSYKIPNLVQEPDCGIQIDRYEITNTGFEEIIWLDGDLIRVFTSNFTFLG